MLPQIWQHKQGDRFHLKDLQLNKWSFIKNKNHGDLSSINP